MFKKLKDKIAEEVKQSPQRFEQISKGLQAAVSSASSTTSEVSGSENFFSITEDDTPQNSPQRGSSNASTPVQQNLLNNNDSNNTSPGSTGSAVLVNVSGNNNGLATAPSPAGTGRMRRLSNSSMASDVSFRLPAYDSPAVYHLETDIDVSASDAESVTGGVANGGQLDLVSKDKLFQAYKKALDRYQKYRERYTELARRYRELEKDNSKARAVLVETQDKALRRMGELREQCVLEQQAKAHLDSALRMEIDELQCVVKTLRSKLELVGGNVTEGGKENDLISLSGEEQGNGSSPIVASLEEKIRALESKLNDELRQKAVLSLEVSELKKREEEHTITVAENKMAIHSELENKEAEVRKMKEQLTSLEKNMKQTLQEKDSLGKEIGELKGKLTAAEKHAVRVKELEGTLSVCNEQKNKLESKFVDFERTIMELEKEKQGIKATNLTLDYEKNELLKKMTELEGKLTGTVNDREALEARVKELEVTAQSLEQSEEMTLKVAQLETEIEQLKVKVTGAKDSESALQQKAKSLEEQLEQKSTELEQAKAARDSMEQQVRETESRIAEREVEIQRMLQQQESSAQELQATKKTLTDTEEEVVRYRKQQTLDQEKLTEVTKALDAANELHDGERKRDEANWKEMFEQNNHLTKELQQAKEKLEKVNGKCKKMTEEKGNLKTQNEQLQSEVKQCRQEIKGLIGQKTVLTEEIRNMKIIGENSESEALHTLQESMRNSMAAAEEKLLETTRDLNLVIESKSEENRKLCEERETLGEKLDTIGREKEDLAKEVTNLKSKIETLRNEKKDLERTLEREIREKSELKAQVTNIIQEIGRLEEQLKDVQTAHATLVEEKRRFEESLDQLQRVHDVAQAKVKRETIGKLETKLHDVECENSQLAEKNCLLEESGRRLNEEMKKLTNTLQEREAGMQKESRNHKEELEEWKRKCGQMEEKVKAVSDQLSQCTGDHAKLFNEKELLDHQHRSLQDELEAKEKEKLCLLDNNKCLEEQLEKVRLECDFLKGKQNELKALLESDKRRLMDQNDALQKELEELTKEKQTFSRNATDLEKRLASYEELKIENEYLNTFTKQLESELQEEKSKAQAKDGELAASRAKLAQNETELQGRDQEIKKLINDFVGKEQEMKAQIALLEANQNEIETLKEELQTNEQRWDDERKKLQEQMAEMERLKSATEETVAARQIQFETDCSRLKEELSDSQQNVDQLRNEKTQWQELKLENENYSRDLEEMKSELNSAIAGKLQQVEENAKLKEQLDRFNAETAESVRSLQSEIERLRQEQAEAPSERTVPEDGNANEGYDEMRNKKEELENKLKKIMHEVQDVSNRNLFLEQKCENYLILEQSNERLKLANEKLSRQLDETLVSMHRNEGIAANTEFEYLRNILFQYLSGSVTGNNNTLVKVIAAVLKFSPQQTEVVLEKEAHRRSLMGQINNLL